MSAPYSIRYTQSKNHPFIFDKIDRGIVFGESNIATGAAMDQVADEMTAGFTAWMAGGACCFRRDGPGFGRWSSGFPNGLLFCRIVHGGRGAGQGWGLALLLFSYLLRRCLAADGGGLAGRGTQPPLRVRGGEGRGENVAERRD